MNKLTFASTLLATSLMTCAGLRAQTLGPKVSVTTPAPDLSKLNVEKIIQQLQTTKLQANSDETSPLQVVA